MNFMLNIDLKKPAIQIGYRDKILLTGSCFTEHIGNSLAELKFSVLQNPNGILFDPLSVTNSLASYAENKQYREDELFHYNELWQSWKHHSRFSNRDQQDCIQRINQSQSQANQFLREAKWIIVTLGSSFSYRLTGSAPGKAGEGVANCHRAPSQWFIKHLLSIDETLTALDNCYHKLMQFNPALNIIFTVSPVRHVRDGVVENNRSKARLLEAVHHMISKFDNLYYFPAYELVIDVLRDYRFYDVDLVHPNYMATTFVLEKFTETFIDDASRELIKDLKPIVIARKHRPFQPGSNAHRQFLQTHLEKAKAIGEKHAFLDLEEEIKFFTHNSITR